jgi:NAD(P)-dependent dehydrogenase (short-subunit alcohol dehydrogenase family)
MANSLKSAPGELHPLKCDVRNESDIKEAFKWVKSKLRGADIHVNNAGVAHFNTLIGESTGISRENFPTFVMYSIPWIAQ